MHKKIIVTTISMVFLFNALTLTPVTVVNATPQENIEKSSLQVKQLDDQIVNLNQELSKLNTEINDLNNKLEENKSEINKTENQIKEKEKEISQKKADIEEKETILGARLKGMYKSNLYSNPLLLLLSSDSLTSFIDNTKAMSKVIALDKKLIGDLESEKQALQENMDELNSKKDKLKTLEDSLSQSLEEISKKKAAQQSALEKLNAEKQKALSAIEENEQALTAHSITTINSSDSSAESINDAIVTLESLLPQLNSSSVKDKVKSSIAKAKEKLQSMQSSNNGGYHLDRGYGVVKRTLQMEATAYCDGLLTATGLRPVRNPSGLSTVAVDPSVIPLGSKVYILGYGLAIAADTGSAIKNLKIDLYMNSNAECYAFGRRSVTVQILAYPGEW